VLRGFELFNAGQFFEQHEALEEAWIEEDGDIRYLYQGILQIGVAMHHLERGNLAGATSLLERGMGYLEAFRPRCMGVDVQQLVQDAEICLWAVRALTPATIAKFDRRLIPRLRYQE
jgi:predicted metal-dependent hydrolase